MNKMIRNAILAVTGILIVLVSCNTENDFYEVGRQPVFLKYPSKDTTWVLNYQKPDSLYRFSWESKRNYIEYNLVFSLSEDMSTQKVEVAAGIKTDFYLTTMQVDSILSSMNIGIGEQHTIYWSIDVVDQEAGWCDEIRKLTITRCDLPTNVIMLDSPSSLAELTLDKANPENLITFSWTCQTEVKDYVLEMSFDSNFDNVIQIENGSEKSHEFSNKYFDDMLKNHGVTLGQSIPLYWRVKGTGNLNNPIENSAKREISIRRFARDPAQVTLTTPAEGSTVLLALESASDMFQFKWSCDTTGVSYKVKVYDKELNVSVEFDAGSNKSYSISQIDFDQLLEQKFEMVASQKKKIYWEVIPNDPLRAVSKHTGTFTVRRFLAVTAAPKIKLTALPTDATAYTLNVSTPTTNLTTVNWDCSATGVTYAIEYSLNADMTHSKVKELTTNKTVGFTHSLLDDMLSDLGASYWTKTVYWRIVTTVAVMTEPSDIHNMKLTGMIKPLVDKRDASFPQTYPVTKIGNNFWMGANLRATKYSDGTAFTTVDLASKTYTGGAVTDANVIGQYYTWPTALRTWQSAGSSENSIIQGVCPDGWHVSTLADWNALISTLSPNPAKKVKSTQYWNNQWEVTNSSGLNLVPGGVFWHGNVGAPDNADSGGKSGYWTTTVGSSTTAYMVEIFDWNSNDIVPWHYLSRPWSEGDGTASKMVNVRCVRNTN